MKRANGIADWRRPRLNNDFFLFDDSKQSPNSSVTWLEVMLDYKLDFLNELIGSTAEWTVVFLLRRIACFGSINVILTDYYGYI